MKFPIFEAIQNELKKADTKYGSMPERVEAIHTLKCEVAELDREVHRAHYDFYAMKNEAIQVAAMAVKFLRDICEMPMTHDPGTTAPVQDSLSLRGQDWKRFSALVLGHIEGYTVPQYGDKGNDQVSPWSADSCTRQIEKYAARHGANARDGQELLDMLKVAHYACIAADKEGLF